MSKLKLALFLALAACGGDDHPATPDGPVAPMPDAPVTPMTACEQLGVTPAALRTDLAWFGTNRADLTGWIDSAGCASPGFDTAHKPIAVFDWDNTISKNDFGDAITYWFIANGKVLQPQDRDWTHSSPYLTTAARAALNAACDALAAPGQPLPTNTTAGANCADEILWIYDNEETRAHAPAFLPANARRLEPDFAWTPQLMAGYTHAEVQQFTTTMMTAMLAAAPDTTQPIGSTMGENGWLRIYDQQKDLIAALHSRGYDVWIITASPQDVIATAAAMVGVPADHVIGIRSMVDASGKLTTSFEGCGGVPDGQHDIIPYIEGKRCYVNKVVFGATGATAWERRPDGQRWVLAAGDSDSDVEFLRDATYKLALNRNKGDLMCHAYYNENDSWRVNPMFIEPKAARTSPYPCSTSTFTNEDGTTGPSRDEGGNVIPDQQDVAHP